jgi:flagellar motor switch protein FliN/FliY
MSDLDDLLSQAESLANEVGGADPAPVSGSEPSPVLAAPASSAPRPELPAAVQRILKLEVPVIVQLAERQMSMQEVLELNVGSVIQFDKSFDSELELVVTNRRIGNGNAVKVGENFGLRVSVIGSLEETIRALGS